MCNNVTLQSIHHKRCFLMGRVLCSLLCHMRTRVRMGPVPGGETLASMTLLGKTHMPYLEQLQHSDIMVYSCAEALFCVLLVF